MDVLTALRKNLERKNPEFRKRGNPERNNLECKSLELTKIYNGVTCSWFRSIKYRPLQAREGATMRGQQTW